MLLCDKVYKCQTTWMFCFAVKYLQWSFIFAHQCVIFYFYFNYPSLQLSSWHLEPFSIHKGKVWAMFKFFGNIPFYDNFAIFTPVQPWKHFHSLSFISNYMYIYGIPVSIGQCLVSIVYILWWNLIVTCQSVTPPKLNGRIFSLK